MDGTIDHVKDAILAVCNRMRAAEKMPRERQRLVEELLSLIYSDDPSEKGGATADLSGIIGESRTRSDVAAIVGDIRCALRDSRDPVKTARLYASLRRLERLNAKLEANE